MSERISGKRLIFIAVFSTLMATTGVNSSSAATFDSVSHFHNLKVVGTQIYLGTHEGLYLLKGRNNMTLVGKEIFDVMGLSAVGNSLYASGHPGNGSELPSPIGFIKSVDGGISWKLISLQKQVDFHMLEAAGSDVYGVDSGSGNLMYSSNAGAKWISLGEAQYSDIAPAPTGKGKAVAIKNGSLIMTSDGFKKSKNVTIKFKVSQIEWTNLGLFALTGKTLLKSVDDGKTWNKLFTFTGDTGLLSASNSKIAVTIGADIFVSTDNGKSFKAIQ